MALPYRYHQHKFTKLERQSEISDIKKCAQKNLGIYLFLIFVVITAAIRRLFVLPVIKVGHPYNTSYTFKFQDTVRKYLKHFKMH